MTIALSILIGFAFGFTLNRVGATNPENIINMVRLTDLRLMKTILFAIGMATLVVFAGASLGLIDTAHFSIKASNLGVLVGGGILGLGFAISGFCPGTGLASAAAGHKDALFFILGGLLGALAYMLVFDVIKGETNLLASLFGGKVTLAETGNTKYEHLITSLPGMAVAALSGLVLIIIAKALPPRDCGSFCPFKKGQE